MPFSPLHEDGRRLRAAKNGVMFHTATTATVDYDERDGEGDEVICSPNFNLSEALAAIFFGSGHCKGSFIINM